MKKLVVFTGAGISAESGIKTFRDSDGLWEEYDVMKVATPEAWEADPDLVLEFYSKRFEQVVEAKPNAGHYTIAELEKNFDVHVITQNIDDLHEKSGSTNVLHLHGEIKKVRSVLNGYCYSAPSDYVKMGDVCPDGGQLRPHVVWFGENVPNLPIAEQIVAEADIFLVVGTSLNVYPAANLIYMCKERCKKYLIDPKPVKANRIERMEFISEKASIGLPMLAERLLEKD